MSNTKQILRLNGYSANELSGMVCDTGIERFKHERTGILGIAASRDTKEARAVVDAVITAPPFGDDGVWPLQAPGSRYRWRHRSCGRRCRARDSSPSSLPRPESL